MTRFVVEGEITNLPESRFVVEGELPQEKETWLETIGKGIMSGLTMIPEGLIVSPAHYLYEVLAFPGKALLGTGGIWETASLGAQKTKEIIKEAQKHWETKAPEKSLQWYVGQAVPQIMNIATISLLSKGLGSTGLTPRLTTSEALSGAKGVLSGEKGVQSAETSQSIRNFIQEYIKSPLGLMSAESGFSKASEILEEGDNIGKATIGGLTQLGLETITEKTPLELLTKPKMGILKRFLSVSASDIGGELLATAGEMSLIDEMLLGKSYSKDDYIKSLVDTAIVSALTSGGLVSMHSAIKKLYNDKAITGNEEADNAVQLARQTLLERIGQISPEARTLLEQGKIKEAVDLIDEIIKQQQKQLEQKIKPVKEETKEELDYIKEQQQIVTPEKIGKIEESTITQQDVTIQQPDKSVKDIGTGRKSIVYTPDNKKIETVFDVVEADDLIVSHDAYGNINPAYPKNLQPRERNRLASQLQIMNIAQNINPELLSDSITVSEGSPIIGKDMVVESGNGRVAAIKLAYESGLAEHYKQYLKDNAKNFGLNPDKISKIKNPVLVRIRQSDVNREHFVLSANQRTTLGMSPAEIAKADAQRLPNDIFQLLSVDESGNIFTPSNKEFINAFLQIMPPQEQAQYFTASGGYTRQLADRIKSAIFAKAYESDKLIELQAEEDSDIKNIITALTAAAPKFVEIKATYKNLGDLDIIPHIVNAVDLIRLAKASKTPYKLYMSNLGLFNEYDQLTLEIAEDIINNMRSAKALTTYFNTIGSEIKKELDKFSQNTLFEIKKKTTKEITDEARQKLKPGITEKERSLFDSGISPEKSKVESRTGQTGIRAEEQKAVKQTEPEIKTETPSSIVNLHLGISPQDITKSTIAFRDWLIEHVPELEKLFGYPTKYQDIHKDLSKIKGFFILPETIARKWGNIYPELRNIYLTFRQYNSEKNEWSIYVDRYWKKLEKKFKAKEIENAIRVYKLSSNKNRLSEEYNNLTNREKWIFDSINAEMKRIRQDFIETSKQHIIEYINNNPQFKDEDLKEKYIDAVKKLDVDAIEHETIKKMVQKVKDFGYRNYYTPQVREGEFMVRVVNKEGETIFAKSFNTYTEAKQYEDRLKNDTAGTISEWFNQAGLKMPLELSAIINAKEYSINTSRLEKLPYEILDGMDFSKAVNFIQAMAEKEEASQSDVYREIASRITEMMMSRNWNKHRIHFENIPGYELDTKKVIKQIKDYMYGYGFTKAKAKALQITTKQWNNLITKYDNLPPNLLINFKDYIDYNFGKRENIFASKLASGIAVYMLFLNIGSSLVNITQNYTFGNAILIAEGLPIYNEKATFDLLTGKLSFSEKKALVRLIKSGQGAMILQEMVGNQSKFSETIKDVALRMGNIKDIANLENATKIFAKSIEIGLLPFKVVEVVKNRMSFFLHTYRALTKKGLSHDAAVNKAIELTLRAHFEGALYNRARFMRGWLGRPATSLMTFNIHATKEAIRLFQEAGFKTAEQKRTLGAAIYLLVVQLLLGGLYALPYIGLGSGGWKILEQLYAWATNGRSLTLDMRQKTKDFYSFIKGGIFGLLGLSGLSQRLAFGFDVDDPTRSIVFFQIFKRILDAEELIKKGMPERAIIRLLPAGFKYIGEALLAKEYGFTTKTGTPLKTEHGQPIKPVTSEWMLRMTGIQPGREIELRENISIVKQAESRREKIIARLRNSLLKDNSLENRIAVINELFEYNQHVKDNYIKAIQKGDFAEASFWKIMHINPVDIRRSLKMKTKGVPMPKAGRMLIEELIEETNVE